MDVFGDANIDVGAQFQTMFWANLPLSALFRDANSCVDGNPSGRLLSAAPRPRKSILESFEAMNF